MHPLGSRETADNIFYNRRDDSLIISGSPMRDICFTNR